VVVAPPEIVSPVACPPAPIVEDASAKRPPFHAVRVVVDCPYEVTVHGQTAASVSVSPRETAPVPERPPPLAIVMEELASWEFAIVPERKLAPMEVVATGAPFSSKAKMLLAAPLRRFQPMVEVAPTVPFMSVDSKVPRKPETVRLVVLAVAKKPVPETVSAVELAYANCEVELAKSPVMYHVGVVVALVLVPKVVRRFQFHGLVRVMVPPRATVPPPVRPEPAVTVTLEFSSCPLPMVEEETKLVPSKAMSLPVEKELALVPPFAIETRPFKKLAPMLVVATILPFWSVERSADESPAPVNHVVPELVKAVVLAPPIIEKRPELIVDEAVEINPARVESPETLRVETSERVPAERTPMVPLAE